MSPNPLTAIKNIAEFKSNDLKEYFASYHIRVNQVGEQLEYYVRDAICNSFKASKNALIHSTGAFSYLGSQNYGPDIIISNGDAFEVKKIENLNTNILHLNNSYPKDRLYKDDNTINQECRNADSGNWTSKEIYYVIGFTSNSKIRNLFFVHGRCYAAERYFYESISGKIKKGIASLCESENLKASETKEIGRINRVDPLRITNFRIRGMWEIENPFSVFSYVYKTSEERNFSLAALVTKEKYFSFPQDDRTALENTKDVRLNTVFINNPNNPAQRMQAQLITLIW